MASKSKKAQNALVWVILLLLVVGLMGFGATSFGGGSRTVAEVGDVDITAERYARAVQSQVNRFTRETGQQITFAQAQQFGIDQAALGALISEAALENETGQLGLSVGDETVSERILANPNFQAADGFDRAAYEFTLERNGLTVRDFEEAIRNEAATNILRSAVGSGIEAPSGFTDTLFQYARETRAATWVRMQPDMLETPVETPDADALRAFYEDNPDPFMRPESRAVTIAALTPDMLEDEVEIADARVRDLYDSRADEYRQPERRLVERLVFRAEDDAEAARARIDAGETSFDELVAGRGLSLDDVDLGDVSAADLGAAADAVFDLDAPGVVGPLPSDLGPALYRMNGILNAREIPYEDVADELRAELATDAARVLIRQQIEDLDDLLAGGATLEELAEDTEMELVTLRWDPSIEDGLGADPAIRQAIAAATEGDFPELAETSDGGVFALRLDEVLPPALRPLDEVTEQARDLLIANLTGDALETQAEALAEDVRGGADLARDGLTAETSDGLTRDDVATSLTAAALTALFEMDEGQIRVIRDGNEVTLLRLDAVAAPDRDDPTNAAAIDRVTAQTSQLIAQDLIAAFTEAAIEDATLRLDAQAIQSINGQFR